MDKTTGTIRVFGKPVPKARPRVTRSGHTYTPARTRAWEAQVADAWRLQAGEKFAGPVRVQIRFYEAPPKSWSKTKRTAALDGELYPTGRPDLDNLTKAVLDGLNGEAWSDDSQVVQLWAAKYYAVADYVFCQVEAIKGESEK